MSDKKATCLVGVDLGGTKILSTIFDTSLEKLGSKKKKTLPSEGSESILEKIVTCIEQAMEKTGFDISEIAAIGVTVPGVFDRKTGVVITTPNLPFSQFPLQSLLEERLSAPVRIENDVNAGTYGEFTKGAAKGYKHVVGIFPGTGIGGGLILDGKLFTGATGNAGEIGHMIINPSGPLCGCGRYGCLEAHASRSAIAKDAVFLANSGAAPQTLEAFGTDYSRYTSKVFSKAGSGGDEAIAALADRAAWYLGIGMANCVNLLSPEVIVIGGGLIERLGDRYLTIAESSMREHAMVGICEEVAVVAASLGDDAAVVGAAALAREHADG